MVSRLRVDDGQTVSGVEPLCVLVGLINLDLELRRAPPSRLVESQGQQFCPDSLAASSWFDIKLVEKCDGP